MTSPASAAATPTTEYWHKYYTPADVAEICASSSTAHLVSGEFPLHLRLYERSRAGPTVIVGHPMLPYGVMMAHLHLPFYRAGFNVVQFDLPGWGYSGGPRAACPVSDLIRAWGDVLAYAHARYADPLYALAISEDSVTCYYALANDARVRAMSFHSLHEYGDPDGLYWLGPRWLTRMHGALVAVAARLAPTLGFPARRAFPWGAIFSSAGDQRLLQLYEHDPLRVRAYKLPLARSLAQRRRPPVRFEDCRTPIQMIVSEKSQMWPTEMHRRSYARLGGPKQWVSLPEMDQWSFGRAFQEMYAGLVMQWFTAHGAAPHVDEVESAP
jgi:alpha-beta hydrolase superfamily lysophospholipase